MNTTADTTAAGNDGGFDPGQAAALLDQTTQQARRRLEPSPPWLLIIRALGILAVFGTVWLTVRGQHPYRYPTAAVIPVVIAFGILNFAATTAVARRATTGLTGRSRLRPAEITILAAAWLGVFAVLPVLAVNGASDGFAYGTYVASAPFIVAGAAWAAIMAARANWRSCGSGLAVAAVGIAAAFAGPAGAWAVAGAGICLELLALAAVTAWQQHRSVVRP